MTANCIQVATSITVVPQQPTVVITPACPCCCSRHNVNTTRCSAGCFAPSQSAVATRQVKPRLEHGAAEVDGSRCNSCDRREERRNASTANDESNCLGHRTTMTTQPHDEDDRRESHVNVPITACHGHAPAATRDVDAAEHRAVRSAVISGCRVRRSHRDVPAERADARTANSHRRLPPRDVRYSPSAVKVERSARQDPSVGDQQSEEDFATCTDQLTTNIYASLAAFQDARENEVIDAVRGYLRRQPSPSSSRCQRPATGRRPATAASDGRGSRTVALRHGDVGPLSSLVVVRPATPQVRTSRANGRPPTLRDGRPRTAAEAATTSNGRHSALPYSSQRAEQQQQRYVVQASELDFE